jgi:hypothetical protein
MKPTKHFRLRDMDPQVWSVATRSAPFTIQLTFVVLAVATWLLGKRPSAQRQVAAMNGYDTMAGTRVTLLAATVTAVAISMIVGWVLVTRESSTARGIGVGLAGSALVTLIGAVTYAYWIF